MVGIVRGLRGNLNADEERCVDVRNIAERRVAASGGVKAAK